MWFWERGGCELTFCSQSSLRSSLCGEILSHSSSKRSSWLTVWMLGRPPSITWLGSTVSSFTLKKKKKKKRHWAGQRQVFSWTCFDSGNDVNGGVRRVGQIAQGGDIMHGKRWLRWLCKCVKPGTNLSAYLHNRHVCYIHFGLGLCKYSDRFYTVDNFVRIWRYINKITLNLVHRVTAYNLSGSLVQYISV